MKNYFRITFRFIEMLIIKLEYINFHRVVRIARKVTKKTLITPIGCLMSVLIFIYITHGTTPSKFIPSTMNFSNINTLVYMTAHDPEEFYSGETMEEVIAGDRNIFFLETGHIKKDSEYNLNARQGCAVESAALMNPTMRVYLFIFNRKTWNYDDRTETILTQLKSYENIVIRYLTLETYLKNSPVDEWWNTTDNLSKTNWFTSHVSDVLRYLTLWKFGGIYLDLDVVVKSSLEHLKDFSCAENPELVASGAFGFDVMEIGRRYANACLFEVITDFRGDVWVHNGPGVITRTLNAICGTKNTSEMTPERCGGFQVLPPSAFYPINHTCWEQYFSLKDANKTMETIENSSSIHVWNKLSHSKIIEVGSGVPYELIANEYCPKVYENCGPTF